jgi:hypothetical protein
MGIIIKAPDKQQVNGPSSVFLAGSITGAENWQNRATELLIPHFDVINPRRDYYDTFDQSIEEEQITWEFDRLRAARYCLVWFSHETLAPITLYELGTKLMEIKLDPTKNFDQISIGATFDYKRRNDVIIQSRLIHPKIRVFSNLEDTCNNLIKNYERA